MKRLNSYFKPVEVEVKGDISNALKRFKGVVYRSNKMKEVYDRREYMKPSRKRRQVLKQAIYRNKKISEQDNT